MDTWSSRTRSCGAFEDPWRAPRVVRASSYCAESGVMHAGTQRGDAAQALFDALLAERLEETIDRAELRGLRRMLPERGRQHECGARSACRRAEEVEAVLAAGKLHVDEHHVDGGRGEQLARFGQASDRGQNVGKPRLLDQLDEIVARRPLVVEYQRAQPVLHDFACSCRRSPKLRRPSAAIRLPSAFRELRGGASPWRW